MRRLSTLLNIILLLAFASCGQNKTTFADAKNLINEKDYESAIQVLNQIIEKDKMFDSAFYQRAIAFEGLGEFQKAIDDYYRAASNPYLRSQSKYSVACIYFNNQDYELALGLCAEIITDDPTFYKAYFGRGFSKMKIELYDNHSTQQSVPQFNFDDKGPFYYDYDGALLDLNKAIELNDKYKPAYISRAQLYQAIHKSDLALKDLNQVIKLDKNNFDAFSNRASLYRELKMPKKALADYNRAIEIKPENPLPYANRGYLKHEQLNDKEGACEDLQKAQELGQPMSEDDKKNCE